MTDSDAADDQTPVPGVATAAPRRSGVTFAVAGVIYLLDQLTKYLAVANLTPEVAQPFIGELLQFRLIRNPGAAFGLSTGTTWLFTLIAAVVVVVVIRLSRTLRSTGWALALGFLLAGASGNLTDRLLRAPGFPQGHVVDFLELPHWPIFNVADSSIVAAAILIAVLGMRGIGLDGQRQPAAGPPRGSDSGAGPDRGPDRAVGDA